MKEILLGGLGGQGVLTAGTMIAEMAIYKGYKATWSLSTARLCAAVRRAAS